MAFELHHQSADSAEFEPMRREINDLRRYNTGYVGEMRHRRLGVRGRWAQILLRLRLSGASLLVTDVFAERGNDHGFKPSEDEDRQP